MAWHTATDYGRPWAGTPQEFAELAKQVGRIAQRASGSTDECWIKVDFAKGRESHYDSPEEFLAGVLPAQVRKTGRLMIGFTARPGSVSVSATVHRGLVPAFRGPLIMVRGVERSAVEDVCRLVTDLFSGGRFVRQGLRRPGHMSWFKGWRARVGVAWVIVLTAAITAVVTFVVTSVLSSDTSTP